MGVVIESEVWELNTALYIFLFISCLFSIFFLPTRTPANVFDHASPASFLRFQRNFLVLFALSSVMEGLWAIFGEYELAYYGLSKEQLLKSLYIGFAVSMFIGSFLGVLSDLLGHRKFCLLFYMLHLSVSIWKIVSGSPTIWLASICLSLASSIYYFSFETLMVVEHDKHGQRQDSLNDMFWLMTFFESASFIGSQLLGNYLIDGNVNKNITSIWNIAVVLAVIALIYAAQYWKENPEKPQSRIIKFHFVDMLPVADGREVSLGLIYPCFLGSKMLGSTGFPWLFHGPLAIRIEEYLMYAFIIMGIAITVVAYDYQEIGVLVTLFCLFHACVGVALPSLARLRTMHVPNEVRGGMMSLSVLPANAAVLFFLVLRGYYQCIGNSTIIAFAALGLFSAAGCMYTLKSQCTLASRRAYTLAVDTIPIHVYSIQVSMPVYWMALEPTAPA
ncbi:UNVERIFIED_CONTAM: hypothetical protein Scaly_2131600 [Sesamum calycinum]|uniref:Major facilitator superfamily protein n=1 Tax=Sesamum calycinum TaxID=2727403 RepID=A0AAW2MPE7_9LAMI